MLSMEERNYSRELDKIIKARGGERPRVLLHACCGPCSTSVLEFLTRHFDVTVYWYNPNLYPESEFDRRQATLNEVIEKMQLSGLVKVIAEPWRNEEYEAAAAGLENEPEGGRRCAACFRLRLSETAKMAKALGFDYFGTTLTVSRYKNAKLINTIGEQVAAETGAVWLPSDFKKKNGEMRSGQLAKELGIYRQNYCGCRYSLKTSLATKGDAYEG